MKSYFLKNNNIDNKYEDRKSLKLKEKKKSVDLYRARMLKRRVSYQSFKYLRPRGSNVSNQNINRKKSLNNSFITYNHNTKNDGLKRNINASFEDSDIDYNGIEKDIKCAILEMKNNCLLEIKRASCDEIEISKKNHLKGDLNSNLMKSKTIDINNKNKSLSKNKEKTIKNKINNEKINIINDKEKVDKININEKFRFYRKGGVIEDSFDETESDEDPEEDKYLINPETTLFFIYDMIIAISSFYSLIFAPYGITIDCFCENNIKRSRYYINYIIDILFIIDLIINFFLQYYDNKDNLIKKRKKIVEKYIKGWFFFDFLTALPFNNILDYYCKKYYLIQICHTYEKYVFIYYFVLLKCLKAFKIFKMNATKKNQFITKIKESISQDPSYNETMNLVIEILLIFFGLHILSCIHIFISKHTYPGWIFSNNFQNYSLLNLYMISLYYLIQTMTTVGYGDISSDSFIEIIFRIILLAVGIICYSWIISNISNGINKQSYASINFTNDCLTLENIRQEHNELPFKVYSEIKNYLEYKHFHQKIYDKNLLIKSLPYTLKNNLIFSMFKTEIKRFKFFKGLLNTNFLSEVLFNFSPITCNKNEIILNENEIIEEIIFVKDGKLSLELPIDTENLEESVNQYLSDEFMKFAFSFKYEDNFNFEEAKISNHSISSLFEEKGEKNIFNLNNKNSKENEKNNIEETKVFYLKIYDIYKDEDYGGIYKFYGKRSPFAVKVKSKRSKLYTIKGDDFSNICEDYKNIIQRKLKKEKKNLKLIKNVLIKTIDKFCI